MNRSFVSFPVDDFLNTKLQMLNWANRFNICCFLDNNNYESGHHRVECLAGVGVLDSITASAGSAFNQLREFGQKHNDWIFGHLGYDLKNETEGLSSRLTDPIGFADLFFFVPEIVIELTATDIRIGSLNGSAADIFQAIIDTAVPHFSPQASNRQIEDKNVGYLQNSKEDSTIMPNQPPGGSNPFTDQSPGLSSIEIRQRYTREEYLDTITRLKDHILRGDCYEINFCQEFYVENINIEALQLFVKLSAKSPNPFAAYYKVDDKYLACASPERYLRKTGLRVISQPIKGTLKRYGNETGKDEAGQLQLAASAKDRSENVMVVDLVRNDLSRICMEGSVVVDELFGVYTFPQVYQMISTVSGELRSTLDWIEVLRATFPMGSMTGAPKQNVLKLIDRYERSGRGIFSGAVGYITPEKDFDFNVVIRSLIYNRSHRYLSFPAGSGITFYSDPEAEYEECLVKVAAIREILE